MGEITANTTQEKAPKKSWFKGLKSEFKKISWPDKETLVKESAAVIVITVVLGFVIALVDMAVNSGVDLIL
jgi:preprotein translocase subunit SecE